MGDRIRPLRRPLDLVTRLSSRPGQIDIDPEIVRLFPIGLVLRRATVSVLRRMRQIR